MPKRPQISTLVLLSLVATLLQSNIPGHASTRVKIGVIGVQYSSNDDSVTTQQYLPQEYSLALSVDGKNISNIDSNGNANCLVAEGNVYCWGYGGYYQFSGNGNQLANPTEISKPDLFGNKKFTEVSVGSNTTCAIADSLAYCWGDGSNGKIGNGASQSVSSPTAVSTLGVLSGKSVTDISVGDSHACAVANGKVYCWGYNYYGQLGDGTSTSSNSPVAVSTSGVLAGKTITAISAGSYHTCAIASGATYCWGYNYYGQLGDGTSTSSNSPVAVITSGPLSGKSVTQISTKSNHTCAIASSAAFCWGYNANGQLGNGSQNNSSVPVAVVTSGVLLNKSVTQISTAAGHSCTTSLTEIFCWGENSSYQLGDTTTINSFSPVKVQTSSTASLATNFHSLFYNNTSASLRFVADNRPYSHNPGLDSSLKARKLPTSESLGSLAGKTITKAVNGYGFACYLVESRVYCAGEENTLGQLGNGTQVVTTNPTEIDMTGSLKGLTITDISAGKAHVCVIASGKVFCWGSNTQGQLGVSDARSTSNSFKTTASLSPVAVDTSGVLTKEMVVQSLSTSHSSTCVVAAGQAFCWGQFVPGFHNNTSSYGAPLPISKLGDLVGKKISKIAISPLEISIWDQQTTCALTADGEAYCWGNNGGNLQVSTPTKLDTPEIGVRKITDIAVGYNFGCLIALGQMYCWGTNTNGQLGTGDNLTVAKPKLVSQVGILKDQEVISMNLSSNRTYFTYRQASTTLLQQRKVIVDAELKAIADAKAAAELELLNATDQAKRDAEAAARERILYGEGAQISSNSTRTVSLALTGVVNEKVDGALKLHSLDIPPTFGGRTATSIQLGTSFACAMAGGVPYCWGNNSYGQLGNGTITTSAVPTAVQLPDKLKGKTINQLSVGGTTACIAVEGEAYCWGNNSYGQLGVSSVTYSMVPIPVDNSGALKNIKVSAIAVGQTHVCAIANNKAFCWGNNESSQLGNSQAKNETNFAPLAVDTDGILKDKIITSIAVGSSHTCVSTDSELFCWGADYQGQLGTGRYGQKVEVKNVKALQFSQSKILKISEIKASSNATCVIADSLLYCWGYNASGRFDSTSTDGIVQPRKIEMVGALLGREIQEVGIGSDYLCVLASSAPICWGANKQGQLGNGSVIDTNTPTKVSSEYVKAGSTLDLAVSNYTSCAIASGRVYCWGTSDQLQGGRITPPTSSTPLPVGVDSSELQFKSISHLQGNEDYPQFTLVADSNPYSLNPRVDKDLNPISAPNLLTNLGPIQGKPITKYVNESEFSCFLVSYEMYCQGSNSLGQLGNKSTQYSYEPIKVDTSGVLKGKQIEDFAMGNAHVCVLAEGEVFCWGNNVYGQLGSSDERDAFGEYKIKFVNQPVAIDTSGVLKGKKVTDIKASTQSTCVVASGEIFCWGVLHSSFKDPKIADKSSSGIPRELQRKGELTGKQISKVVLPPQIYSSSLICALADNRAYCWSTGRSTGSLNKEVNLPHVVGDKSLSARPVSDLALSNSHACLISMGEVFCWGENSSGQLGIGNINSQSMPALMESETILKNREVFAIGLTSTSTLVAHRELTADKAKTFAVLKTEIQKQVAEEERLQALAEAEAKAKAEAEAKAKANLARKSELNAIQTNLTQRIQNLSQNIAAMQSKCEAISRNLTAQQRLAIARTSISTSCDKYSDTTKLLSKDLAVIEIEDVNELNYPSKLSAFNSITKQISNIEETYNLYFNDASRIGSDFENLIYLEDLYAKSAIKDLRSWLILDSRVQKLPSSIKKSIIDKTNYRNALTKVALLETAQKNFESYRTTLATIANTKEVSSAATQLASIVAKLEQAESLYLDLAAIEKLIPAYVCVKGGTVTPLLKSGKCLAGAKRTSTK